jgi:phosphatidylglycerophosphate synthase
MAYRETLREIRLRAQRKTGNLYDTWFTRTVSAWITAALAPLPVSPNAVSAANVLLGMAICGLIGLGETRTEVVAGAALLHLYAILDSVDGELARYHRRSSIKGVFLENWSAFLMINSYFLAVAALLTRELPQLGNLPLWIAVAHAAVARNAMAAGRRTILEVMQKNRQLAREAAAGVSRTLMRPARARALRRFVEDTLLNYTNMWVVLSTLIVIGFPRLTFAAFAFYMTGLFAKELGIVAVLIGTNRLDSEVAMAYGDDAS